MKIVAVTSVIVAIPRTARLTLSGGSRDDATTVLVKIETDTGITGVGQTIVDPPAFGAAGIKANIDAYLTPLLIGQSPAAIERLHGMMKRALPDHRATHAAIDLALWDLNGKARDVPVHQLIGERLREGIALMAMVAHADPATMARETEHLLATPYPVLKVKIGMGVADDLARYRAVHAAADDRATIQVDGNGGYTLDEAVAALTAMEAIGGLGMIEQPVARMDDLTALAHRFSTPVMADESFAGLETLAEIAQRGAVRAAFLKLPKQGGIRGALAAARLAERAGIALSIAVYYDVLAAAAAHVAVALPAITWPSFVTRLSDSILVAPLTPEGLLLRPPAGPGLGVTLDDEKVRQYRVER